MNTYKTFCQCCLFLAVISFNSSCYGSVSDTTATFHKVTLSEAHIGNLEIDTKLLDSYGLLPENFRQFYLDARLVFSKTSDIDFTNREIIQAARKYDLPLMGGPMLGKLSEDGVTLWMRPSTADPMAVRVTKTDGSDEKLYMNDSIKPGVVHRIVLDGLSSDTDYRYMVYAKNRRIAKGSFTTAPAYDTNGTFRLAFGSCFHKIGLHNPNLINEILLREPRAMMLLGDIAVDDRESQISMHRSDYLLRDVSKSWRLLSGNIPLYACWDDHDYFNNDLSGIPKGFSEADRDAVRVVWHQNWNNPGNHSKGIYFNKRIGPVEIIMLDTRSFRETDRRGQYGSYLGIDQLTWLKEILKKSVAPFKIISSGTMWSDDISNGKDSWGTWDIMAREELLNLIETENIPGVILISGDRHGARGLTIPRPSGYKFYEFEVGTLGGVPGPSAMAKDATNQLFGHIGEGTIAFGEFTFDTQGDKPSAIFRLIDELGNILEERTLSYDQLTPGKF